MQLFYLKICVFHLFSVILRGKAKSICMTREQFIEMHKDLFWYTPADKKADISDSLLVETILNDGTLDDYKSLLQVLSAQHVARVFFAAKGRQKQNYYPEIYHFYSLILSKYVH